jgi:hypothetical protein
MPMLLFVGLVIVSSALAEDPWRAFRSSGYYVVTGFLTAFVIVNTIGTIRFARWTARIIALASAVISALALFQVFLTNYAVVESGAPRPPSSILGYPEILAVYLVLGIPLLLAELSTAATRPLRDFWLVCTTISFVGVFLTQTRVGLLALLVTTAVFLVRRRNHAPAVVGLLVLCVLLVSSLGAGRLSPRSIVEAGQTWLANQSDALAGRSPGQWLLGTGATVAVATTEAAARETAPAPSENMHLTLLLEHGILGWLITMGLVISTIAAIARAHRRARDESLRVLLWAIVASLAGSVVSMASANTFHYLSIQVFFWSLIGIGLNVVTHVNRHRRTNLIWRFGAAGD